MLAPGATIGILGGGQLGRMTALAAARLGYRCHVFADEPDSPTAQVCGAATVAEFADREALERFASAVDIITFEFENIPAEAVRRVAALKPVLPRPEILEIAQDRLREKDFLRSIGVETTAYREISDPAALLRAMRDFGYPAVLKTVRLGYDGKGQVTLTPEIKAEEAWRRMGGESGILESFVDFSCEISVIVARGANGAWATYPPVENQHVNHVLDTTIAPARIPAETAMRAEAIARHVAEKLDLVGVLAVEMFVTQSGATPRQRDRAAPAQFGSLDDRRLLHQPIRAARAGDLRAPARLGRAPLRCCHEEPVRQRRRQVARCAE